MRAPPPLGTEPPGRLTHRRSRALVLLAVLLVFLPTVLRGEVLFAHDNTLEAGAPPGPGGPQGNRTLSDQGLIFLPEIEHQLHGDRASWISTWNPHVELGRPDAQVGGFGRAYHLALLLSLVEGDAFRLYTWLAIAAVLLCGLLGHLLLETFGLRPAACLAGALGLSLGGFPLHWLAFVLFLWTVAWTLGVLWASASFVRRPTAASFVGIAFCVHSLLLSGYPQQIVWNAWLAAGFVLVLVARRPGTGRGRLAVLAGLAGAAALGAASAVPVLADLALLAERSPRTEVDPGFFTSILPRLEGIGDAGSIAVQLFDASWFGDPSRSAYPLAFDGVTLAPPLAMLAAASLALWRRLWPALAFVGLALLATVWVPAYRFGVEHLLLDISRFRPLAGAWVALVALAALAADARLRGELRGRPAVLLGAAAAVLAGVGLAVSPHAADAGRVAVGAALAAATMVFLVRPSAGWLAAISLAGVAATAFPLPLSRSPDSIALRSPLVDRLRRETADGSRVAFVDKRGTNPVPPNEEALLGLRSVHAYDSLSSRDYQAWASRISDRGTFFHGRYFLSVVGTEKLFGPELPYTGIGAIVATRPLDPDRAEPVGLGVHRPRVLPRLQASFDRFARTGNGDTTVDFAAAEPRAVERVVDRDDRTVLRAEPSDRETLWFVSRQHHPQWRARAGGRELPVVRVNGFYSGVVVPPGIAEVELRFEPWARWSFVPQIAFLLAFAGILVRRRFARRGP